MHVMHLLLYVARICRTVKTERDRFGKENSTKTAGRLQEFTEGQHLERILKTSCQRVRAYVACLAAVVESVGLLPELQKLRHKHGIKGLLADVSVDIALALIFVVLCPCWTLHILYYTILIFCNRIR